MKVKGSIGKIFTSVIGRKLFIGFLSSLIPLFLVSLIGVKIVYDRVLDQQSHSLELTIQTKKQHVEFFFDKIVKDMQTQSLFKSNAYLLQYLDHLFVSLELDAKEFGKSKERRTTLEKFGPDLQVFAKNNSYQDYMMVNLEGVVLYSTAGDDNLGKSIFAVNDISDQLTLTFRRALKADKPVFSDLLKYGQVETGLTSFLVQKVSGSKGDAIGFLVFRISPSKINEFLQKDFDMGQSADIFIVGLDGIMRSESMLSNKWTMMERLVDYDLVKRWGAGRKWNRSEFGKEVSATRPYFPVAYFKDQQRDAKVMAKLEEIHVVDMYGMDWALVAQVDVSESLGFMWDLGSVVLVTFLFTILVVCWVGIQIVDSIVAPVNALSVWAEKIAIGDFSYSEIKITDDEIGDLKMCFDRVVQSFRDVTDVCKSIAVGDFNIAIPVRSDEDALGLAVKQMAGGLDLVVKQANAVAQGDYSTDLTPRSDKDVLVTALLNMTNTLKNITHSNQQQDWLKTGYGDLHDLLRGQKKLNLLCQDIISFMAKYLEAGVGALYLLEKSDDQDVIRQVSTYALKRRKTLANEFAVGEGLVGQVAQEGEMIVISNVPSDYVVMQSGTGEAQPLFLAAIPIFFNNELKGVLELGAFHDFSELELEFLRNCMEDIGIALNTTESRGKMAGLLDESRQHEKQLAIQQEELRQTVEELETQTKALKKSEEHLNVQQEELRVTNEELEEQTKALQQQKDAISQKNTDLEDARREIEEKANKLARSSKYKSEFLANMSHELRTPLNSILLLSQLLETNSENTLQEKELEYIRAIHSSGAELLELITDILDLSKVEAGRLDINIEDIGFTEINGSLQQTFSKMASGKDIAFETQIASGLPENIRTDNQRLLQILKNLVSNGIKFTHDGHVTLNCMRPTLDTVFNESSLEHHKAVAFQVTDTGVGISDDKQQVIFEAFQQADGTISRKYGGTGLGLSLSKKLASLLGGEIQMSSVIGEGSVFTLYLPEIIKTASGELAEAEPSKPLRKKRRRVVDPERDEGEKPVLAKLKENVAFIDDDRENLEQGDRVLLIIEDDPEFAKILLGLVRQRGFKCLVVKDGEAGLHYADFYKPVAIILDIGLPGMDGWEVMERLKEFPATRHIPVHFMSAFDQSADALRMGAIGYITKPVSVQDLEVALSRIEDFVSRDIKKVLIIENDDIQRNSIVDLITNEHLDITAVNSGEKAFDELHQRLFDIMILDLNLGDMSGFDLLDKVSKNRLVANMPIIIYTGRDLTREEESLLQKYADSIIIKGIRSPERLLAETTLFLHQVEKDLPAEKQKMIRMVSDKDSSLAGKKILVVDDDMRNVFALSNLLQAQGLEVSVGNNGLECLEVLNGDPDVELVLMDIMMPEMDGYEAMRRIREQNRFRDLPIIALTAKAMRGDRDKCIEAGANDYLPKPVDMPKLLSLLRVWLYR